MSPFKGFSLIEVLVITGVLILIGGLGIVAWKSFGQEKAESATSVSNTDTAEVITTAEDLNRAEQQLESLKVEDESSAEAESQASF